MRRSIPGESKRRANSPKESEEKKPRYQKGKMKATLMDVLLLHDKICEESRGMVVPQDHGQLPTNRSGTGRGQTSLKTPSCIAEILERVARGETLHRIGKDEHMPHESTMWNWVRYDEEFREMYFEAKKMQMDAFAEQIITIADDSVGDIRMAYDKNGDPYPEVNYENVKRSELRTKVRMWLMERLMPKKYSEKVQLDTPSGNPLVNATIQIVLPDNGRPIEARTIDVTEG